MSSYLKAYQAYQLRNYEQCLKFLKDIKDNNVAKLDLQAQVYFQLKEYQKAHDIYQELIDKHKDDYIQQRKENLMILIVCAQLEQPGTLVTRSKDKVPTIEDIVDQIDHIKLKDDATQDVTSKPEPSKRRQKHKKRTLKLPKSYDPVAGPDPERWLPRRDRRGNAHRRKKKQRPNVRGRARAK